MSGYLKVFTMRREELKKLWWDLPHNSEYNKVKKELKAFVVNAKSFDVVRVNDMATYYSTKTTPHESLQDALTFVIALMKDEMYEDYELIMK
tara:strand:- start:569 stop:844 length:276 start_codon:yes stop_codon:yes gene_type:complete